MVEITRFEYDLLYLLLPLFGTLAVCFFIVMLFQFSEIKRGKNEHLEVVDDYETKLAKCKKHSALVVSLYEEEVDRLNGHLRDVDCSSIDCTTHLRNMYTCLNTISHGLTALGEAIDEEAGSVLVKLDEIEEGNVECQTTCQSETGACSATTSRRTSER